VERPAGSTAGSGGGVIGSHRQAHQCRISHGSLYTGCQHHDTRARFGNRTTPAARRSIGAGSTGPSSPSPSSIGIGTHARIGAGIGGQRSVAVAAPDFECRPRRAGGSQEAAGAEAFARLRAGPACTCDAG